MRDTPKPVADALGESVFAEGDRFVGGGNRPIQLSNPELVWYVVKGAVDVFLAECAEGEAPSDFKLLLRAGAGRLIFGIPGAEGAMSAMYVGKALQDTELRSVRREALGDAGLADLLCQQVDAWVGDIAAAISRDVAPRPRPERFLSAGDELNVEGESVLTTRQGVAWVWAQGGNAAFLDAAEPAPDGLGRVPVTPHSWIRLFASAQVTAASTRALRQDGTLFQALAEFHRMTLAADEFNRRLALVDMANQQRTQAEYRRRSEERARDGLFNILNARRAAAGGDVPPLRRALELIGAHEGISFRFPASRPSGDAPGAGQLVRQLEEIPRASGVRARVVRLASDERWWLGDSGALLAFHRRSGRPVALLPRRGGYRVVDPETGATARLTAGLARELRDDARFFYRPLPRQGAERGRSLFPFAFRGLRRDVARFALAGGASGLLTLMPAILLGRLVDDVIPTGTGWLLVELALALVLLAGLAAVVIVLQGMSMMRLEALAAARLGAAVWDRLLGLPQRFHRRFAAGDLAMRAMTFEGMRDRLSGVVGASLLTVVFLLPTFLLLFLYNALIGWLGLGLGLAAFGVTLFFGVRQLPVHRRLLAVSQRLSGKLLRLLTGIRKLRSTGAEGIGFALWANDYGEQKRAEMRLGAMNEHLTAFLAAAPLLAAAAMFAVAAHGGAETLRTGDFLTVYAAFMAFFTAVSGLGRSFSEVVAVLPGYERVKPILQAVPETAAEGEPPPELSGDVRIDRVSFRYAEDGPLVLRDVSIHARPGEFVAIVGESGAGKTTLFRLALGLEAPVSGTVYYDGRDLARLNKRAVRSRVSMVVQDASLQPGTVLDNIIGLSTSLTEDDAWRAARLAAVDEDIAAMSMRMHTAVTGASTFSGGQIQRIMLAGALARDPTVLYLDEATNWLDNDNQAAVMRNVAELAITRVVSAHRLSTIRMADSIYVLRDGRVAQTGTFDELMRADGPFRDLVRRQMA